jgi:glucosyl-dolichyl phosphate glucuronosyltransferase
MQYITVAICTWNRCLLLRQALEQMTKLVIPSEIQWELLVVNNNSTDATDEVIVSFSDRLPIRGLFEPKQGLSNARNHALSEAQGSHILWVDDDVFVDCDWMAEYMKAVAKWPDTAFFGGVIEPLFEIEPPPWIRCHLDEKRLEGVYAMRNLGGDIRPFRPDEVPYGANMAFRTEILREFAFNPRLGRAGNGMLSGDELELIDRLRHSGYHGVWVGTARVRHYIPAERLTKKYLWDFYRGLSRTHCHRSGQSPGPYLWNAPRWAIRKYLECLLKTFVSGPFKGRRWLNAFLEAAYWRGVIDESRQGRLEAKL